MSEKRFGPGLGKGRRYVGIDQSYTGFGLTALSEDGGWETYVFKAPGKGIDRLLAIEDWLTDRVLRWDLSPLAAVENVAVEAPVQRTPSALISGGLFAIVLRTLRRNLPKAEAQFPLQVPPTTLKKYVTGKGTIDKNMILLHVFKKWGIELDDDNAADSYGLARIAAGLADHAYEREVLKVLQDPKHRGK